MQLTLVAISTCLNPPFSLPATGLSTSAISSTDVLVFSGCTCIALLSVDLDVPLNGLKADKNKGSCCETGPPHSLHTEAI